MRTIRFFGEKDANISGKFGAVYLEDIRPATSLTDIPDPVFWTEDTIELAASILLQQASNT